MKNHFDEYKYKCSRCKGNLAFKSKENLLHHIRTSHNQPLSQNGKLAKKEAVSAGLHRYYTTKIIHELNEEYYKERRNIKLKKKEIDFKYYEGLSLRLIAPIIVLCIFINLIFIIPSLIAIFLIILDTIYGYY